jgi:hypothetical protein
MEGIISGENIEPQRTYKRQFKVKDVRKNKDK